MNALLNHKWGLSAPQDRVWAQVAGLAPGAAVGRLLMSLNFQAFIDESESKEEFVLAGHIAPAEKWASFAKEWEELLPFGTRARNGKFHFKMSEMMASNEGRERVRLFYRVIEKYVTVSVSCRINLVDFEQATERFKALCIRLSLSVDLAKWKNPYFVLFRALMDQFHNSRENLAAILPLDEKVDFYFDDRSEKSFILAAWDEYLENREGNLRQYYGAVPRFEDDQDFLPLQAADLWAWKVRDWYEEDAIALPDKMEAFDFGNWRGERRPSIAISYSEDQLLDTLQTAMFGSLWNAHRDGKPLFGDKP